MKVKQELDASAASARLDETKRVEVQDVIPLSDITATANSEQRPKRAIETFSCDLENTAVANIMDLLPSVEDKREKSAIPATCPATRIVLSYLVLTNFKSYAGRQEVGPFHTSFSSVVGPNGSGKSNVIDSLLFVFGFRASKMRQGKLSALIHNSAAFPDLDFCEVEVRFREVIDRDNGIVELVSDTQLVISRKAFKNNSSRYYINGSESNFTTVTNLLRERGVDLDHKRFLILQGEVESIAQMKPKAATEHDDGLLEYLEDIIGTSRYKPAIEECAAKAESLNEVCLEKNNRVQHVEKEKKALQGKKDEALSIMQVENELALKQSALYQVYIAECDGGIKVTEEAIERLQTQFEQEIKRHNGSEDDIAALKKTHVAEQKQYEKMEQNLQSVLKQLAKLEKDSVKYEEKKKHMTAKVKKLEKSRSASQVLVQEANAYLERLGEDLLSTLR